MVGYVLEEEEKTRDDETVAAEDYKLMDEERGRVG